MGETLRNKRDELNKALFELIQNSDNEILDHEYETKDEWGFIECINSNGQEVKLVFTENPTVSVYIDGICQNT